MVGEDADNTMWRRSLLSRPGDCLTRSGAFGEGVEPRGPPPSVRELVGQRLDDLFGVGWSNTEFRTHGGEAFAAGPASVRSAARPPRALPRAATRPAWASLVQPDP